MDKTTTTTAKCTRSTLLTNFTKLHLTLYNIITNTYTKITYTANMFIIIIRRRGVNINDGSDIHQYAAANFEKYSQMSETFVDIMRTELHQSSSNVHKMHYTSNTASQKLITQFKTSKSSIVVFKCVTLFSISAKFFVPLFDWVECLLRTISSRQKSWQDYFSNAEISSVAKTSAKYQNKIWKKENNENNDERKYSKDLSQVNL